jgi:arylformamidase
MPKATLPLPSSDYLDAQYNNRLRVPDFLTRHVVPWQADSQRVREQQACVLDVAYGPSPAERLDVFPAGGTGQPVVVFLHGGYWRSLDKADHAFIAPAFTAQGACVVVPNYALCSPSSAVTIEDIALQCARSVVWVQRNIEQYGGNSAHITVIGHSAGGHLAAMLAACDWKKIGADLPTVALQSAIGISGLYDLAPVMRAPYLQNDLRLTASQVQRCSPAYFKAPRTRFVAVCGGAESEEFLRQNALIEKAWGKRAVAVREALGQHNHFSVLESLITQGERLHALARAEIFGR